jgi:hypothetical protein
MASPEAWLRSAIEDAADCAAYPLQAPETVAPPYVLYSRSSTARERDLNGSAGAPVGTFAVEIYADGYTDAKALADLVRGAVNDFSGIAEGSTIDDVELTEEADGDPVYFDGRDKPTYVISQTYLIRWQE